jgi:hypothetical protein
MEPWVPTGRCAGSHQLLSGEYAPRRRARSGSSRDFQGLACMMAASEVQTSWLRLRNVDRGHDGERNEVPKLALPTG